MIAAAPELAGMIGPEMRRPESEPLISSLSFPPHAQLYALHTELPYRFVNICKHMNAVNSFCKLLSVNLLLWTVTQSMLAPLLLAANLGSVRKTRDINHASLVSIDSS